jgi:hypothetical protein
MRTLIIRRCPVCETIKAHTLQVAQALRQEGLDVEVVDGTRGEFSVWAGDLEIARNLLELPSADTIQAALGHAEHAVLS